MLCAVIASKLLWLGPNPHFRRAEQGAAGPPGGMEGELQASRARVDKTEEDGCQQAQISVILNGMEGRKSVHGGVLGPWMSEHWVQAITGWLENRCCTWARARQDGMARSRPSAKLGMAVPVA